MQRWAGLLARLVVGGVWLVAGIVKFPDPAGNVRQVRAFDILPEAVVPTVGHLLPTLEIVVGALLVLGLFTRVVGVVSALMQLAFIIGIASAWARGIEIRCGCFGGGSGYDPDYAKHYSLDLLRDTTLMLLSLWLAWRPRTALSLDALVLRPVSSHPSSDEEYADVDQ